MDQKWEIGHEKDNKGSIPYVRPKLEESFLADPYSLTDSFKIITSHWQATIAMTKSKQCHSSQLLKYENDSEVSPKSNHRIRKQKDNNQLSPNKKKLKK